MEGDDRRRSFSQVVIGFSEEQSEALRDQDESFYGYSSDSSESDDSSDSSDTAERSPLAGGYVSSDAEENLDDSFLSPVSDAEENLDDSFLSPVAASEASALGAPAAAAKKKTRAPSVESSLADVEERRIHGCDCRGGNCFLNVSAEDLKTARDLTEELNKASRLIFICGKLDTLANRGETLQHVSAARRAATSRARVSYRYEINQTKVCLAVLLFAYSVSSHELHTVQSHLDAGIVVPVPHGSVGVKPWHAVTAEEVTKVRDFILNYASINGLPQPSAPRGHNVAAPTYLPSVCTKKLIHALYMKAGETVSYQTFDKLWLRDCPDIIIMKPTQKFRFSAAELGKVRMSDSTTMDDRTTTILKATADTTSMNSTKLPSVIEPAGMSRARADYLYKQIRPTTMRKIATLRAQIQVKPWRSDVRVFSVLCSQHTIHCIFYNNTNLSFTFLICF